MTRYFTYHHTCFVYMIPRLYVIPRYMQDLKKAYDLLDLDILYPIFWIRSRETGLKVSIHTFDF